MGVKLGHDGEILAINGGLFLFFPEFILVGKMGVKWGQNHREEEAAEG